MGVQNNVNCFREHVCTSKSHLSLFYKIFAVNECTFEIKNALKVRKIDFVMTTWCARSLPTLWNATPL